ncbi:MAG: hypothetical protein WCO42_02450 [bacterium]
MSTNKPSRTVFLRGITMVGIALLLLLLWRQQSELARLKTNYNQLQDQNLALLNNSLQPQPPTPAQTPAPVKQNVVITSPVPSPSHTDKNLLVFTGTEVQQTTNGLIAIMRFKPSKTGPLGLVAMSVRLPSDIDSTIQSIAPVGTTKYEDSDSTVSENGRFAFFQGTLGDEKDVAIALGVSGSAQAFIKGSCGINAFQLDIQPTNATVLGM